MLKENEIINYSGNDIADVLKDIEIMLLSLRNIGSYYASKHYEGSIDINSGQYEKETTKFIDEWEVTQRLARIRSVLSNEFDDTLGEDDMDDLERCMEGINVWRKPSE